MQDGERERDSGTVPPHGGTSNPQHPSPPDRDVSDRSERESENTKEGRFDPSNPHPTRPGGKYGSDPARS